MEVRNKKTEESPQDIEQLTGKIVVYFKNIETGELDKEYRNVSMDRIKEKVEKTSLNGISNRSLTFSLSNQIDEEYLSLLENHLKTEKILI